MWMLLVSLSIVFQSALLTPVADDLIISLPDGQVQGTTYITDKNKTYYGFQGIPFATPPLGSLRFEAPLLPQPWTGVWDATKDSNGCFSSYISIDQATHSEDCLYISVYTPSLKPAEKLPVMYYIYGGGFTSGNAGKHQLGPDFLIEEDVIIVSANYRVGPFGFLSTGDSAIVGNAGLKDQALAIKWTYDNIELFGGDSSKITIFGDSAGGASTGLQLVSKKAAGLYRAAIVESGSALTDWSINTNPKAYADLLATQFGGETYLNDTQKLKTFLQGIAGKKLSDMANSLMGQANAGPVIEVENDDAFLTEPPYELLDSGRFNQVPIVIGICANEAGIFIQDLETAQALALRYDTSPESLIPSNLRQNSSDNDAVTKILQNLYLEEGETFSDNLVTLSNFESDTSFTRGVIKHGEVASKYVPVYLYQFSYGGRPLYPYVVPGAEKTTHGSELLFLFNLPRSDTTDPTDILTQNRLVKLWTNFAKFLNPTPEQTELINVVWPTISENNLTFLNINATLEVQPSIRGARYEGWKYVYETYGKKPFITF